ncbi:hypothetical protein PBI_SCTP2_86 [Salicola phage SCTP-2]|nr:hypothetical protein PBI_SCTP2_86 [Salicola phage SCTP-2]
MKLIPNRFVKLKNVTPFDILTFYTLELENDQHPFPKSSHNEYSKITYVDNESDIRIKQYSLYETILKPIYDSCFWNLDSIKTVKSNIDNGKNLWEGIKFYHINDTATDDQFIQHSYSYEDGFNDYYTARYLSKVHSELDSIKICNLFHDGDYSFINNTIEHIDNIKNKDFSQGDPHETVKDGLLIHHYSNNIKMHNNNVLNYNYNVLIDSFDDIENQLFPVESIIECSSFSALSSNAFKQVIKYLYEKNSNNFDMLNNDTAVHKDYPSMFCENSNLYRSYIRSQDDNNVLNTLYHDASIIDSMIERVTSIDLISRKWQSIDSKETFEKYIDQCFVFCKNTIEKFFNIHIDMKDDYQIGLIGKLVFWLLNIYYSFNETHVEHFFNVPYLNQFSDENFEMPLIILRGYNITYTMSVDISEEFRYTNLKQFSKLTGFDKDYKRMERNELYKNSSNGEYLYSFQAEYEGDFNSSNTNTIQDKNLYDEVLANTHENISENIKMMIAFDYAINDFSKDNIVDFNDFESILDSETFKTIMNKSIQQLYDEGYRKTISLNSCEPHDALTPGDIKRDAIVYSQSEEGDKRSYRIPYDNGINPNDPKECVYDLVSTCSSLCDIIFYNIKMNVVDEFINDFIINKEHINEIENYNPIEHLVVDGSREYNVSAILSLNKLVNQMFIGNIVINKTMVDDINMNVSYLVNFLKHTTEVGNEFYFVFDSVEYFKKFTSLIKVIFYGLDHYLGNRKTYHDLEDVSEATHITSLFDKKIRLLMKYKKHNNRFKLQYNVDETQKVFEKLFQESRQRDIFTNY